MSYAEDANDSVDNIVYDEAQLSKTGSHTTLREVWMPRAQAWSPVYNTITEPFSFDHYTSPRLPIDLGRFDLPDLSTLPRILRMTVKPVGSLVMALPDELAPLHSFLQQVLEYEYMVNPNLEACEAHLTLDYSFVEADATQRFPGWHVDGLQGGKFKDKLLAEHSYIMATNNPTEFCMQPFFIKHYDEDITNFFKTFDQQARPENVYRGLPHHLYLMDAYMVHRTPVIREATDRAFLRLTIANAPLPIEHNTLNPMLDQDRAPFKLDIRDWLREPDLGINYEFYGLATPDASTEKLAPEAVLASRKRAKQDVGEFKDDVLTPGFTFEAKNHTYPKVQPLSPTYRDMTEPFEPRKYTNPRLPIDLGTANVDAIQKCPNVLRMPLKWWDSATIHVPAEFEPIKALLNRIFAYDRCHNPLYHEQAVHITHDSRVVQPGLTHRFPGFHGDDLEGGAFPKKEIAAHSYILTTAPGTEFCLQPFFVGHLEDTHERLFTEFDKQAREENIVKVRDGHVYLMDPYAVHRTPQEVGSGLRTFLRITFSPKNLLLPHNTLNPMLSDRQAEYEALPAPHLHETFWTQESDKTIPYESYGVVPVGD